MSHDPLVIFQRHLEAQGKRPGTQDSYVGVLARFLRSIDLPIGSITEQHVYDHLVERGTAAGLSRSWYNVIFHALASWLEMRGLPTELRGLRPKRVHIQPVRWFRAHEASDLMGGIEDLRYRTLFMTMLGTGMRIGEVRMLRVADVDRERPLIQVREGKGGDGRYVRCEPTLRRVLRAHWQRWRVTDLLFPRHPGSPGQPMEPATLNAALRRSAERCGLAGQVSSHRLRHTFAMHSLQGGMDVVALSRLMGHRCIQSTVRYVTPDLARPVVAVDVLAVLGVQP
jgi:integrase